ncbi:hypothetical protein E3U55_04345 [Filobacillus milosensis]|uniref:Lipoprotein n=1 Tax=Filobacillus milosensis TaxID=94137 RepID=A0A4Y8IR38_9BACI|nr:hypothetical protein [Filobacillus milosensis]TFB24048.1 hypothetical protein E3U55_04345 [Filobacillus milosensis]
MKKTLILVISLLILTACSSEEDIVIDNKTSFKRLVVQKVINNSSSTDLSKTVEDTETIQEILNLVEELEVERSNNDDIFKLIKSKDTYILGFYNEQYHFTDHFPYSFYVTENGTFIFLQRRVDESWTPRISLKQHKDLLDEMLEIAEVDF